MVSPALNAYRLSMRARRDNEIPTFKGISEQDFTNKFAHQNSQTIVV